MPYAIRVWSDEARSAAPGKPVVTEKGTRFWVTNEPEGWVPASSVWDSGTVPGDIKTFMYYEDAEKFAKKWKGFPWWCKPIDYEIIEVEPVYREVIIGYKIME
jgi:hypothetical protein